MKVLFILFTFVVQIGLAQTMPVFQVLYVEKASLSNVAPLKSSDKLLDETIHYKKGYCLSRAGILILINSIGKCLVTILKEQVNNHLTFFGINSDSEEKSPNTASVLVVGKK